jgi:hypothetical protein
LDGDGLYPLIEGFNSSSKGFRFPRNPIDLASTLLWFSDNFRDHPNTTELKDAMRENCNLSKTRINYLLNKISNIVFPTAPRITLADWSTAQPIDANSICSSLRDLVYSVFDENESKTVIKAKKQYFAEALSYLGEEE